jgi:hypothetical protein
MKAPDPAMFPPVARLVEKFPGAQGVVQPLFFFPQKNYDFRVCEVYVIAALASSASTWYLGVNQSGTDGETIAEVQTLPTPTTGATLANLMFGVNLPLLTDFNNTNYQATIPPDFVVPVGCQLYIRCDDTVDAQFQTGFVLTSAAV